VARDFDKTVKVSAGVKDGDRVILNPPVDLVDGRKSRSGLPRWRGMRLQRFSA
jgi:hypothetical protein